MRVARLAFIAYYYFDFKDASKRDIRGLLASLLFQLGSCSDSHWDMLHQLYATYQDGTRHPVKRLLRGASKTSLRAKSRFSFYRILWTNVRIPLERHPPVKRCWTSWRTLFGPIPIYLCALQVVPNKIYRLSLIP